MVKKLPLVALVLVCSVVPGWAQGRFELQPFVGIKTGGNLPVECTNTCVSSLNFSKINLNGSLSYGATAGFNASDNFGLEFMWNRQPTVAVGRLSTGNSAQHVGVNVDQYQGNLVYSFFEKEKKFRPFILAGVGTTKLSAGGDRDWRISYGIGGGVKYFMTPHMGVRLQARYSPTFLYATQDGAWCNWWGVCYSTNTGHYLQQFDMTAGWVIRF
jgi:opacity protein-like surface antigen